MGQIVQDRLHPLDHLVASTQISQKLLALDAASASLAAPPRRLLYARPVAREQGQAQWGATGGTESFSEGTAVATWGSWRKGKAFWSGICLSSFEGHLLRCVKRSIRVIYGSRLHCRSAGTGFVCGLAVDNYKVTMFCDFGVPTCVSQLFICWLVLGGGAVFVECRV